MEALGPRDTIYEFCASDLTPELERYVEDQYSIKGKPDEIPELTATPEFNDQYFNADLMLPHGGKEARGRVAKFTCDNDGNPMVGANSNPILDSHQYMVNFEDSNEDELAENVIAQSMYAQFEPDGKQYLLLDSTVEFFRSTTALCHEDHKLVNNGRTYLRRSTPGWKLCCQCRDESTSWKKLANLKESHPIQTSEYAISQHLQVEAVFNWWVPYVLKKRDSIILLVKK